MHARILPVAGLIGAVAFGAGTTPAQAGSTEAWSTIDSGMVNIDRPAMKRSGGKVRVYWTKAAGPGAMLRTRTVNANGSSGAIATLLSGWSTLSEDPVPLPSGLALAGLRGSPVDPDHWPGRAFRTSYTGALTGTLSANQSAYASSGMDAIEVGGTPITIMANGGQVLLHRGTDIGSDQVLGGGPCCVYSPAIAAAAPGTAWTAWVSFTDSMALVAKRLTGLPGGATVGTPRHAPGATVGGDLILPAQRIAMTRRPGGQVWIGYVMGYPTAKRIRLWQPDSDRYTDIRVGGSVRHVSLSSDTKGRLWAAWYNAASRRVQVARSNADVTAFGGVNAVKVPSRGDRAAYSTAIDATPGFRADVLINTGSTIEHRQFYPGLNVSAKVLQITKKKGKKKVTLQVHVADAGTGLKGATVRVVGVGTKKTGKAGNATFTFTKGRKKKVAVEVTQPGYVGRSLKVALKK